MCCMSVCTYIVRFSLMVSVMLIVVNEYGLVLQVVTKRRPVNHLYELLLDRNKEGNKEALQGGAKHK